jgi:AraC-like DNA-binding protein
MSNFQTQFWPDNSTPGVSVQQWTGDHWDGISYFPKRYQIGMVEIGTLALTHKEQDDVFDAKSVFFIRPGMIHAVQNQQTTQNTTTSVIIEAETMALLAEEFGANLSVFSGIDTLRLPDETAQISLRMSFLLYTRQLIEPIIGLNTRSLLTEAIWELLAVFQSGKISHSANSQAVERAQKYLQSRFLEKVTLDDLADVAFVSKYHLLRLFKEQTGLTPHVYQLHLRLNEGRKMLMRGQSLADVVYALNFTDQAHFIHAFKRYADLSPKKYQQQFRNFLQFLPS